LIERSIKKNMSEETERHQQILEAAFAEFAHKGFHGATIKSIAKAAGLQAPSLIYWYFPTKEDLFQAVIAARSPFLQAVLDPTPWLDLPPEEALPLLGRGYLSALEQPDVQQMGRLILSEVARRPHIAEMVSQRFILRALDFLKIYLVHQVELGRLRPHDVRVSARAFIGMLLPQALSIVFFPALRAGGLTSAEHLNTAIEIFLGGLRPAKPIFRTLKTE
jgi:TetR/AcrR family transcriptional regulator